MPRKGYDITGCAPGTPAAEAAARARQRAAPGNRTPRAGTPINPCRHDGDEQETPRASRIGVSGGNMPAAPPAYSQINVMQDDRGFQVQRRLPREELYQNPLNISSIHAANQFMARAISGPHGNPVPLEWQPSIFPGIAPPAATGQGIGFINAPAQFSSATFETADFGATQQQLWNSNQFHALPASQHGIQSYPMAHPGPASFAHYQTAAGAAQFPAPTITNVGTLASQNTDDDADMTGVDQ
ncbi:hypothetical protein V8C42DRAFT_356724 [Trichoderma barbatum]